LISTEIEFEIILFLLLVLVNYTTEIKIIDIITTYPSSGISGGELFKSSAEIEIFLSLFIFLGSFLFSFCCLFGHDLFGLFPFPLFLFGCLF